MTSLFTITEATAKIAELERRLKVAEFILKETSDILDEIEKDDCNCWACARIRAILKGVGH